MTVNKRNIILFFIASFVIGVLGAFVGANIFQTGSNVPNKMDVPFTKNKSDSELEEDLQLIKQAYELIDHHYIEDVDKDELIEGAIQGMLDTLDDPYSSFMNHEAMERFQEQIQSSFQGIGAEVSMVDGKVTIVAPIKDSPAEKAGLRPNDQILQVDGEELDGLDLNEAVEKIRGEKGSEVVLLVQRKGASNPFEVTIVRDDIPIETVEAKVTEHDGKKTGVIHIHSFAETTVTEFTEALEEIESKDVDGLVIDVRDNPGGLLDAIEDILQLFVPQDIPYLQIEDGQGRVEEYYSTLEEKKPYPISVIINEGSASASEILAVAMKEIGYDVVGETSFGKGTVQQAVPLQAANGESTIKLTFYKWLSPKGNWINEVGVEPTVKQKQPDYFYVQPLHVEETLKIDDTDEQIETAQKMLTGLGYDPKRKDGYFDEQTKQAVTAFQRDHHLQETGEIDAKTAGELESKVIEKIRSGKDDKQLQKAIEVLYK